MNNQEKQHKVRTSAILNLVAGLLFIVAAFNLLTGEAGINWMYVFVGVVFIVGGVWGLWK
jgi:hypothetical protein